MNQITIREYGVLFSSDTENSMVEEDNLDCRVIKKSAWDWLLATTGTDEHKFLVKPIRRHNHMGLQVVNYVGVITTPCGCQIEILPKIISHEDGDDNDYLKYVRGKMFTMLNAVKWLKFKQFHNASLEVFNQPLPDVLIRLFLDEVTLLIKKGIRNDYVAVRDETSFLKGRLQIAAQIRQPIGRQHLFQVEYDEFLPDRAENRLIHSALRKVAKWSRTIENRRLANELSFVFDDIPLSINTKFDFTQWLDRDRSMVHYRGLKEWCELIINEESPFSLAGSKHSMSFLFPMNDLFEAYVAHIIRKQLKSEYKLVEQSSRHSLVKFANSDMFQLKPDIVIRDQKGHDKWVLDCKWKRINSEDKTKKFDISQGDMYQLFAYGQKYMNGSGDMLLIYPESETFKAPMTDCFVFHEERLRLWVVPFIWGKNREQDSIQFQNRHMNEDFFI